MKTKLLLFMLFVFGLTHAQEAVSTMTIEHYATKTPAQGIVVSVNGTNYTTDGLGMIKIPNSLLTDKTQIHISMDDYQPVDQLFVNGMVVRLVPVVNEAATIALSMSDLDANDGDTESTPGLLFSSGDAYSSISGYAWGPYWFRVRGYQSNYQDIYIDGINMANPERGYASWSLWGGLNDVTRNKEVTYNVSPVDYGFSNVGGTTNIITDASKQRPGFRGSYSYSNGAYANRIMLTYSTGLMENGWAVTASASRRWAQEGYVEGTTYDAWAGFLGIEKEFTSNHSLGLTAFVAPSTRGQQGSTVQEAYDLKGTNYYNPYWGYQDGEKRNSREKTVVTPQFILKDNWHISDKVALKTSAGFSFGKQNRTALNWYDAPDPRPDYYRNLPSYQYDQGNDIAGDMLTEAWESDDYGQINWDAMYQINYNNVETVPVNWLEQDGTTTTGKRAHYIVENRIQETMQFDLNPTVLWDISDKTSVRTGLQYQYYNGRNYNTVNDLLGADYYVDIDNFADRDFVDPESAVNDLNDPNVIKGEGDVISHDYDAYIQDAKWWGQLQNSFSNGTYYIGANVGYESMYRYGNRNKGLFPDELSYGKSEVLDFTTYGAKIGGEYFVNGRNVFTINASYDKDAPLYVDSFTSLRTRNETVDGLTTSTVVSGDLNYYYRGQDFKVRASLFYTEISDLTDVISYYDDAYQNFVNYILTGVGQQNSGIELGVQYNITQELRVKAAGTYAKYLYNEDPLATTTIDNSSEVLNQDETVYYTGRHVGGSPETAGSIGLEYWSKRYWFVGVQGNFLGSRYVTLNPARYTDRAISEPGIVYGSDQYYEVINQEEMANAFTLDFSAGKNWKIDDYFLRLNFNINNVLNATDIATTGYQQYRYDYVDGNPEKFANKYYYAQGIRAFLNVSVNF